MVKKPTLGSRSGSFAYIPYVMSFMPTLFLPTGHQVVTFRVGKLGQSLSSESEGDGGHEFEPRDSLPMNLSQESPGRMKAKPL